MGGQGSGRKPSEDTIIKRQQPKDTPVGDGIFLPNYSGIREGAKRTSEQAFLQSGDNISLLNNDAGYVTSIGTVAYTDLTGDPSDVITAGDNLSWAGSTLNAVNTTYTASDFNHDDLSAIPANDHIDWTITQTSNIHSDNYTDTTYTASSFDIKDLTDSTNLRTSWSAKWDYDEDTIKAVKVDNAVNADTVNSLTVETAVPVGALFTDTTFSYSSPLSKSGGTVSISQANTTTNGYLSSTDWNTFNDKLNTGGWYDTTQNTINLSGFNDDLTYQSPLTFSGPLSESTGTVSISQASDAEDGYLTSADWSNFNNKADTDTTYTAGTGLTLSDTEFSTNDGEIDHNSLDNYEVDEHRTINDTGTGTTDLWSANKINSELGDKADSADLDDKADESDVSATVIHGSTAGTSRPSGFASVMWIGSVEPTNAENDDIWVDTS